MKKLILLVCVLGLSGCATYKELSDGEKAAFWISSAIIVGAGIVANSNDTTVINDICIAERSKNTDCIGN